MLGICRLFLYSLAVETQVLWMLPKYLVNHWLNLNEDLGEQFLYLHLQIV